jgi:argininosuccinate lyase
VETIVHSAAFGDTNDVEDPMFVPLNRAFDAAEMVLRLLAAVLSTAAFNVSGMEQRAAEGNTTTTALADALVQEHGIPFRGAHTIVSRIVSCTMSDDVPITAELVNEVSREVLGRSLDVTQEFVANALDPWTFVNARTIPGGPAPETTRQALRAARLRLGEDRDVLAGDNAALNDASTERQRRIDALMAGTGS